MKQAHGFPERKNSGKTMTIKTIRWCIYVCWICWHQTAALMTPNYGYLYSRALIPVHSSSNAMMKMVNLDDGKIEPDKSDDEDVPDPKFVSRTNHWVLVVDDEEPIRMAVGDYLYDQGFQVTACADADSFLKIFETSDGVTKIPDCIVSDIRMPGKDGIELLGIIRADPILSKVPVVLLTAKAMSNDRVLGYRAGADAYLPKPFDPDELLSIIDNLILRRKQMRGQGGTLLELKEDITKIKEIMKRNTGSVVKQTDVFLTNRERDILERLCQGFTNAEIAEERKTSLFDINRSVQKLRQKTSCRNKTELVRWAISTGYVSRS